MILPCAAYLDGPVRRRRPVRGRAGPARSGGHRGGHQHRADAPRSRPRSTPPRRRSEGSSRAWPSSQPRRPAGAPLADTRCPSSPSPDSSRRPVGRSASARRALRRGVAGPGDRGPGRGTRRHQRGRGGGLRRAAAGPLAAHRDGPRRWVAPDPSLPPLPADMMPATAVHERLAQLTRAVIEEAAARGNAVIVGRGGAYIVPRGRDVLHVQLHAPLEARIRYLLTRVEEIPPTPALTSRRSGSCAGRSMPGAPSTSSAPSARSGWTPRATTCRSTPARWASRSPWTSSRWRPAGTTQRAFRPVAGARRDDRAGP